VNRSGLNLLWPSLLARRAMLAEAHGRCSPDSTAYQLSVAVHPHQIS